MGALWHNKVNELNVLFWHGDSPHNYVSNDIFGLAVSPGLTKILPIEKFIIFLDTLYGIFMEQTANQIVLGDRSVSDDSARERLSHYIFDRVGIWMIAHGIAVSESHDHQLICSLCGTVTEGIVILTPCPRIYSQLAGEKIAFQNNILELIQFDHCLIAWIRNPGI